MITMARSFASTNHEPLLILL